MICQEVFENKFILAEGNGKAPLRRGGFIRALRE
jgi:hypothetical protein